jgi:hypothetical protein
MASDHGHSTDAIVVAVFSDRGSAEAAVDRLIADGFGSEHLGVAVRSEDSVVFEHDDEADSARDIAKGVGVGAPLGAIAGIALISVTTGGLGLGGALAMGGAGAIWGVILGGAAGLARGEGARSEHEQLLTEHLEPGQVMVVVDGHDRIHTVTQTLLDHGAAIWPAP